MLSIVPTVALVFTIIFFRAEQAINQSDHVITLDQSAASYQVTWSLLTNQQSVTSSSDYSWPIRSQLQFHVINLDQSEASFRASWSLLTNQQPWLYSLEYSSEQNKAWLYRVSKKLLWYKRRGNVHWELVSTRFETCHDLHYSRLQKKQRESFWKKLYLSAQTSGLHICEFLSWQLFQNKRIDT